MKTIKFIKLLALSFIIFLSFESCNSQERGEEVKKDKNKYIAENIYTEASNQYDSQNTDEANRIISGTRQNAITKAVAICSPAIVGINVTEVYQVEYRDPIYDDPFFRYFFGDRNPSRRTRKYSVQGLGSGFIISPDGYILTNHHVAGNASKIIVTTTDGKKHDAEIIGADETTDVALLKIKGNNLPYLKLANSNDVVIGEWVIAFGNPFGLFDMNAKPTVTVGVISNKGVSFLNDNRVYKDMIQTDAAISSGNSGGPLVNALGEVVGMNTVIFSTAQSQQGAGSIGIGFSIPINRVKKVIDIFKKDKSINRNFITGMDIRDIDDQIARYLGIKRTDGVVIISITRNSPAEQAGFEPGDIIIEIEGTSIIKSDDYYLIVNDAVVGDRLNIKIIRQGSELTKTLFLQPSRRR